MRLADYIDTHVEAIVDAAEAFAATLLPAAARLDAEALRDHLPLILEAVAADLRTPQTAEEEHAKSEGGGPCPPGAPETAAQTHARLRAKDGFRIEQLVAEYRALRAGVLRLWQRSEHSLDAPAFADMVRFNEAIDQAVAESVDVFTREVDRWRQLFLGVLGHDLRNPLNAIMLAAQLLSRLSTDERARRHTASLIRSGQRMKALLDDLLDFNRVTLGLGIAIHRTSVDLGAACEEEVDLLRTALPGHPIEYRGEGSLQGDFDASRIREALGNLVSNAAKHGRAGSPVRVKLVGDAEAVRLCVANEGAPLDAATLEALFEPLRRGSVEPRDASAQDGHLGLGLFIVREIARAHGGELEVACAQGWTTFTVSLPRGSGGTQPAG